MAEKEQIIKEELSHSGLFDFKGLYSFMHSWLVEDGNDVDEEKYSEKVSGNSKDIDIEWKVAKKVSDYFRNEYKIAFEIKKLTDVEVEIDGQKKNMNKGDLKIKFSGTLVMDYDSKWETSPFSRFTRDIYNKYVIPARVSAAKTRVTETVVRCKETAKSYLSLTARR
jgi:hypothetical protein